MNVNLSSLIKARHTFSNSPFCFVDPEPRKALSNILDLILTESGNPKDIDHWQKAQLLNLVSHCMLKSTFWRNRLEPATGKQFKLEKLPIQSRLDVTQQVADESALIGSDMGAVVTKHSTSGSSGRPINFYVTNINSNYNKFRSAAQFIMDERDLSLNMTRIGYASLSIKKEPFLTKSDHWLPHLYPFIKSGIYKQIAYTDTSKEEINKIINEIKKNDIGLLVAAPWMLEPILDVISPRDLYKYGARSCIVYGSHIDPQIREQIESAKIQVSESYSCEEIGPIAFECTKLSGNYHVATSNVIVETDAKQRVNINGRVLEKILVTHLHSYATPFIRYDLGDYVHYSKGCPCGFKGPTLSNIVGRSKTLISLPQGGFAPFHIEGDYLFSLADVREYRIRQKALDRIDAQFVLSDNSDTRQINALECKLRSIFGPMITLYLTIVDAINWENDRKREGFINEVLNE